jgi:hypothetical protein
MGRTLDKCKLQLQADACSSYGFLGIATGALTKGHTLDMVGEHGVVLDNIKLRKLERSLLEV